MVRSFGVDGISEAGMARYGVCAVVFWEGSGKEKKVFEVCGRGDRDGTEAGVSGWGIDPEYGWMVGSIGVEEEGRKDGIR
jgi:hypothetical protein